MLVRLTKQPQYLRYLQSVDVRIPSKQLTALNQALDGHPLQIIPNPCKQSHPHISVELLPLSIFVVAKYLQEGNSGRTSLTLLQQFASSHCPKLIDLLSKEELPCQIFSLSILRSLQDCLRSPLATNSPIALPFLIDLFTAVCESQQQSSSSKKDKPNRWVFQTLLLITSYHYIRENQFSRDGAVERAIRAVSALVNNSENEKDFDIMRELISVVSLMTIFNGCKAKSVQILDILNAQQISFIQKEEIPESINHWISTKYIQALRTYLKMDPHYLVEMEKILRKLLMTEVSSPMLINHFQALILLIRERGSNSPHIRQVTSRLLLTENELNIKTIDQVCKLLLNSNADLLEPDAQQFNLLLATRGSKARRQSFLEAYYELYRQNNRLFPIVINFIFETALELNISLQDFAIFVTKEAGNFTDDVILKLHQQIRKTKQARFLQFLAIIVEYRRRSAFNDEQELPLVKREWAQQIASVPEALLIYMETICKVVTDRSLEVHPALINMSSLIVKIQGEAFARGRQYYHLLLSIALRQKIYHEQLLRYFVLAETIFGVGDAKNMKYFSSLLEKVNDQLSFLTYLEYLVTLLKSASSVIMYFKALICFERASSESFRTKSLFQVSFLRRLIQQSNYFRIQSYSPVAVVLLYELCLIISDNDTNISEESERIFYEDFDYIMQAWSSLMNQSSCRNICYFFCFRQICKIFPYLHERELKNPRKRLFRSWDLLLTLLDYEVKPQEYLHSKCEITAEWKAEQLHKRTLSIEGNWMRNSNMTLSWQLKIITTSRAYELLIMNDRLIYSINAQNRDRQVKEFPIRKLSKNPELVNFNCQIDNVAKGKSMVALYLMGITQMVHDNSLQIDGSILRIHIKCNSQALLKGLIIKDTNSCRSISPKQHLNDLHKWEIRLSSLTSIKESSFSDRFDFQQALCQLGEMLQNFKQIQLSSTYDMFLELAYRMINHNFPFLSSQFKTMNTVFSLLASALGRLRQELNLQPTLPHPPEEASSYFHLLTSALLPEALWKHLTNQGKKNVVKVASLCLNNESFRRIQNQTTEFFELICNLVGGFLPEPLLAPLLVQCIELHDPNEVLSIKFNHFIVKAGQSESDLIKQQLGKLLIHLTEFLNLQNQKYVRERVLCKFLIPQNKALKAIFCACPVKAKIAVLHYFANGNQINRTSPQFVSAVSPLMALMKAQQSQNIACWLLTELKQLVAPNGRGLTSLSPRSRSVENLPAISLYLNVLVRNLVNVDKECEQISLEVVHKLLEWLMRCRRPMLSMQHEKLLTSDDYLQFLVRIGQKPAISLSQCQKRVLELSFEIVSIFSKPNFLSFMVGWRRTAADFCQALLFPLNYLLPKRLSIYGISILLQYVFEVLLLVQDSLHFQDKESNSLVSACNGYFMTVLQESHSTRLPRPQLYAFPRLFSQKEAPSEEKLSTRLRQVDRQVLVEMKGGIYFKMAVILIKFINLSPQINRSDCLEKLIFCYCFEDNRQSRQSKVPPETRGPYEAKMVEALNQHKQYCQREDGPLHLSPYTVDNEADLTPYITDYLLMNLADFIKDNFDKIPEAIVKQYTTILLQALESYPKICKDVCEEKQWSDWRLLNYIELFKLRQKRDQPIIPVSPPRPLRINSPSTSEASSFHSFENLFNINNNSPSRRQRKRTFDATSAEGKQKTQLLQSIRSNSANWQKFNHLRFAGFFCQKAKELKLIELLHQHWVILRPERKSTVYVVPPQEQLARTHNETMKIYRAKYRERLGRIDQCLRRVRKIYPYTSAQPTVLKISENCLANMACPITIRVPVKDYRTRNKISINGGFFTASGQIMPYELSDQQTQNWSEPINCTVDQQDLLESEEMNIIGSQYCEWVTRQGVYFCEWELNQHGLRLKSRDIRPDPKDIPSQKQVEKSFLRPEKKLDPYWYLLLGAPTSNLIKTSGVQLLLSFDEVQEVFSRKYNQVSNSALQLFMKDGTSKFIAFYTLKLQATFVKQLEKLRKNSRRLRIYRDPIKQFENLGYRQKWTEGSISNFDYIMLINKFSGRSYNDLNQYYVFPWVLSDYTSQKLDLSDPNVFRDLSRPVGAVNPQKLRRYKQKYRMDQGSQRCLFGSHYSTSLFVFYFLVRLQPFSSLHRDMQRGQFDVADRLFSSVAQVWQNLMSESSTSDIKEAMPEFYYMTAFLRNMGHIDLGNKQCGQEVGDVELPPWAATPQQFIVTLRAALESDIVSEKLHLWIDLIFGRHQYSEERNNIFHPYSYTDCFDFQEIAKKSLSHLEGIICQISYFGQCPIQLFRKDHPPKKLHLEQKTVSRSALRRTPSTSSQASLSDKTLPDGYRLIKLEVEGFSFYLEVEKSNSQRQWMMISALNDFESGRDIFDKCDPPRKENNRSVIVKIENQRTELRAGKELLLELEVDWDFKRVETNEMWIACIGVKGLRIYNWQLELCWRWEEEEVVDIYQESTRLIFATPTGKICFYSFFNQKLQKTQAFSGVSDLQMKVMMLPRLPYAGEQKRNLTQYRILCVADGRNVSVLLHTFEEIYNHKSS